MLTVTLNTRSWKQNIQGKLVAVREDHFLRSSMSEGGKAFEVLIRHYENSWF